MHIYAYTCIYIYQAANPLICPFNLIWWLLSDGFCAFESNNQSELPSRLDWLFPVVFVFSLVLGFVCFLYFWSRFCRCADTIVENTQYTLGIAIYGSTPVWTLPFNGQFTFGLSPFGLFGNTRTCRLSPFELPMTFGLSPFGLFWTTRTCRLSPFGLLWRMDYRR